MDWSSLGLSLSLAALTVLLLTPLAMALAHVLALRRFAGRWLVQAVLTAPLVLPPTVMGYYLLMALAPGAPLSRAFEGLFGHGLAFSFEGLVIAAVIVNAPFSIHPMQRAFAAIDREMREAAMVSGLAPWAVFTRIDLPLAWPGVISAMALTFAHTMGEFGVMLMVGGAIPGETRTASIAIYDRVQALDNAAAGMLSASLLAVSLIALAFTFAFARDGERGP